MTRVILISGKGGVGKTTIAAATAARAAALGHPSLVASRDRAHNLGDVLGAQLSSEPVKIAGAAKLWAMEADPQAELRRQWRALSGYFARFFAWAGLGGAEADEIAVLPGLEELLVLSRLTELVESQRFAVIVVDLAPTASSLRLLSFPELMAGPFGRLVKLERSFLRVTRPALKRVLSMPLPEEDAYRALEQIATRLVRLRAILTDPAATIVRLVSIPERVVLDETRSAFTLLSLFGLCVDAVVLNRVLPRELGRGYLGAWTRIQARELARAEEQFGTAALLRLRFWPDEVIGLDALLGVAAELYGDRDPSLPYLDAPPVRFSVDARATTLELRLPHALGRALDLKQRGDDLIITVGGWRRQLPLPESLRGRAVRSARFAGGALLIRFAQKEDES
jgi:arsenite-transporting ATPase